jgi:hypothetical protein
MRLLAGCALVAATGIAEAQRPSIVRIVRGAEGFQLLRDGKPYFVKGAGGGDYLERLKAAGGNSIRTWGVDEKTGELLDRAHRLGLTVTLGIWLGHERHGFKYDDPKRVAEQLAQCRKWVQKYRHHPAVLFWALGNEMEGSGDNPLIWKHINDLARMVKQEDPNHPVMTVIAEIGGPKIAMLKQHCPDIDALGINSYGGMPSLVRRLKEQKWEKPYLITEFGPLGPWEVRKTKWGAPIEPTPTQKADSYLSNYMRVVALQRGWSLGSYTFLWGSKQEATATWFGMFLKEGLATAAVDAMTYAWTGRYPANRAPQIFCLETEADEQEVAAGAKLTAQVMAEDPDGDPLTVRWEVCSENTDRREGGDFEADPPSHPDAIVAAQAMRLTFHAPKKHGPYRLFVYVSDGKGSAATMNVPFLVK